MIEMLKARKEQLESRGVKGFTLMEMLIVIAIIAILIAIAIPVFINQLNSAKEATDEANARSLYAQLTADHMLGNVNETQVGDGTINGNSNFEYQGTTYKFSDVMNGGTINLEGDAPTVSIETNGHNYSFGS